ncbi:MAG TPA: DUF4384 domain-containing protein [Pyrinomonadaceae bacterium]|nr:DUF4384 domain-containing protein [Pyrinomonadaceae bacterium]
MFLRPITLKSFGISLFIFALATVAATQQQDPAPAQDENGRAIVADEFLKKRPGNPRIRKRPPATYHVVTSAPKRSDQPKLQVGVTIWKLEPAGSPNAERSGFGSHWNRDDWTSRRVEADVKFRKGDTLRISIESPRDGYLYVVNRDWLADGTYGETNLIFPTQGEDNRLQAGKLIDIPAQDEPPFKASPNANQSSELLTIIVTKSPLKLRLGPKAIPVSQTQLREWEERWGGEATRLEMNGGAGQTRTTEEQLAASRTRIRQLTRDDPMPQTIYSVVPKNTDGLLFNLVLHYVQ